MNKILQAFILVYALVHCNGGYADRQESQSDVQAPEYVPSYLKNYRPSNNYSYRKPGSPTKNGYSGTKNGYPGTKNGYSGTKNGYPPSNNGYSSTKNMYGERRTWDTNYGNGPTYQEFQHSASQQYTAKCVPACKNNGICVATNTCQCSSNYRGTYCEFERKPCLAYPPLPMNSRRNCSSEFCTIKCMDGHKFIDGSTVANMRCNDGQWQPTRADFTTIPDCQPECTPPCQNGGVCLALDTCQCPEDYRGPQCQYAASVCDVRKLGFNGGYSCFGDSEKFSCKLNCPEGATYSSPRAPIYSCLYSSGVFQPQPIPHCVFNDAIIVTPSNYHQSSHYESHSWQSSSQSQGSSHYGGGSEPTFDQSSMHGTGGQTQMIVQDLTPKGGTCLTWAGVHYKTFDGKIYSFKSSCSHILVRDRVDHKYTVAVTPGDCTRRGYCPSEITIYLEEKPYTLSVHPEDNSVIFRSTKRLIPIPASLPGIRVSMPSDHVVVNLDTAGLTLKWDTNDVILIEASVVLWNKTEGLCGSLNSSPQDDFTTKEMTAAKTTTAMASSWQLHTIGDLCESNPSDLKSCATQTDEIKKKALQFCTKIFSKEKFRKCSKIMDVTLLLEACQGDYCACANGDNPEECGCNTAAVYAKECLRHGVQEMRYWRDSDTCPKSCPDGKEYKVCGPDVQASCAFPDLSTTPNNDTCAEGCYCPAGQLLEGGRCLPRDQCPCRLRTKVFPPGKTIPKDCNTCTCQAGEWKCTQAQCGARCSAVGDPHYTSFDGQRYDFMGHCTYTLMQADNITIQVENVACSGAITEAMNLAPYKGEGKPSCTKAVNVMYDGAQIHLKQGGLILVNGREVTALPVNVGNVRIRAASSLFVIVQLPLKVDIWWDGNTRVFVDVPPTFQGKTKGLCGTFNQNQKDDFLTPEGDIEQSTMAFANKWKTREFCEDLDIKEPEHPCKANMQNKESAEKYCSRLKSKLFEECHWYVDVDPYYESCLYDMCACAGEVSRCLCPIVGDYAMACAKAGVKVQWRYNVKECELQCTGGQEYTVCADSCMRTCTDVALASAGAACRPCCVEGCACPPGQVLDETNVCVPQGLCPCHHKGMTFPAGHKEVRPGRRERELCTCVGARWQCVPATPADVQNYPPVEDLRSNCSAAAHMEFTTCELAEPLTCKNMHLPPTTTSAECRPGCQCKKGYVLDMSSKKCVEANQCPCHHGGRSYPDGHIMMEECNKCECKSGKWSCTTKACAGVCGAWGDSHLTTFDSAAYDFEGVCTYLLAKGVMDSSDGFDVEIQNVPCGTTGATCSKSTTLKVGGKGNQEVVSLTKDAPLPDVSKLKRIKLRVAGAFVFLDVPSLGMSLQWDRGLRVYVKVDPIWKGRVKGLCGNFNGDMRDDFQTPSGGGLPESSAIVFADSWKLKQTCPKPKEVTDYCKIRPERKQWAVSVCGEMKRYPFSLCAAEVAAGPYIERCERDACACDAGADCDCACAALAAYAHACALRAVPLTWRTAALCPMQCDEECSNYDGCISACPLETCDTLLDEASANCQQDTCVEGCKPKKSCPEGQVYSNSSMTECVPKGKCKNVCMTLPDGKEVLEGDVLEEDECHTCRCSKNQRVCTGQPCSTTEEPVTSPRPHDEPLKCVSGWTAWVSAHTPSPAADGASTEVEPLPLLKDLQIGSPMCSKEMMTNIECRTKLNHETPKQTGLDVECSLERGLVCRESSGVCPDFEIRVHCECGAFQCLNATRPSYQHPEDCTKFYECTPDLMNPDKPHSVLKSCVTGTMYNPVSMVCDWPAAVYAVRPECEETTLRPTTPTTTTTKTTTTAAPTTEESSPSPSPEQASTVGLCAPGQVFQDCAYPCHQLCDHYLLTLLERGQCTPGEECIGGCVDKSVAATKCGKGYRWRDAKTCVLVKDCTCYSGGKMVKPGGVVVDGCTKCQCLENNLHCDSSECSETTKEDVLVPRLMPFIITTPATITSVSTDAPTTKTTQPPTTVTTPLIVKNTESPPPVCSPNGYVNLLWDQQSQRDVKFTASSIASPQFEPEYAILDGKPNEISAGSWSPMFTDKQSYIQMEFPQPEPIYGVIVQGSPLFDQYITSYELLYGNDGTTFSYVDQPDGTPQVFRGPIDHTTGQKQMLPQPVEAKILRLKPLTWHDDIALRLEVIGCRQLSTTPEDITSTTPEPMQCTEPLGLAAGLPLESIEVSSNNEARPHFRMDGPRGWRPAFSTPGEWIMFDFTEPRNLTGIKTKGGPKGWVSSYKVMYTSDLSTFNPVLDNTGEFKLFPANFDKNSEVVNMFRVPIRARYLKVLPIKWQNDIEMRIEPIGCFEPYPIATTLVPEAPQQPVTTPACLVCPGVVNASCVCSSPDAPYYDGQRCVPRDLCPCVEGYTTYGVGSVFYGENCTECMCKLGGVTDCKPVKECKCAPTLVPRLVPKPSCSCECEPCPAGTLICPTSKACIPAEKWCDGLLDCPDDERDCTTTLLTTLEPTVVTTVLPTVAQTQAPPTTTVQPLVCPVVECPRGYKVQLVSASSHYRIDTADLPPPRPRNSYQRYHRGYSKGGYSSGYSKGGYSKSGYSKGGYSKGGYSKGGYSKGGYGGIPPPPSSSQAFTLDKPTETEPITTAQKQECQQFRCVPQLPPPPRPGSTAAPIVCSVPSCPPQYALHLAPTKDISAYCPLYTCVPPPERLAYCNVTGSQVSTFDGADYKYDLCYHILARSTSSRNPWSVLVRKKCRVDGCQNELIIYQDDQLIKLKPNLMIEYDNYEYTVEQTSKICFQKNSFDVVKLGNGLLVKSRKYNFTVFYNSDGDIKIGISKQYMGSVDGLCGAFDGSLHNERRMPDGTIALNSEQMGRAWGRPGLPRDACRSKVIDEARKRRAYVLCDAMVKEPLAKCATVLNLAKWRGICLEGLCKCTELVVNGTHRTEEQCRCLLVEKMVAECLAANKDIDISSWRMVLNCPAECPAPLAHYDCYRKKCEPACSSLGAARRACAADDGHCFPGCYCPEGTLRQGDRCLPPADCRDCVCKGVGTPADYTTFEGDNFPFLGNCTYLASRDTNSTGHHNYEVYATNGPCEDSPQATCTKAVHIMYDKKVIHITKDNATKKLMTTFGDTAVFKYPVQKDWVTVSQLMGQDVSVLLTDAHVEVIVLQSKMELSVQVPSFLYRNRTEGLCGVCAGQNEHLVTSNGTVTDDFEEYAKSWQASPGALAALGVPRAQCDEPPPPPPPPPCEPPPPEDNLCYTLYNADKFGACHALVDPEPFLETCNDELCTLNKTDVCGTLERYAAACRAQGVCLDWRAPTLCPSPCSLPLVYRSCVDCERTCDNHAALAAAPGDCHALPVEGCFCPEGKVRVNNTCIEPTKCFPCDADKEHYAGDEWQENACKKCTCSKLAGENAAHITCTTQTCIESVCGQDEDMISKPAPPDACCPQYICLPKPQAQCKEPKKMVCGFGQVLKQKTTASGCKEFACECKPASECEHIPNDSEVDLMEPGIERLIDETGCCPKVELVCRKEKCPKPPTCPKFHTMVTVNITGKCCLAYDCELPKDQCIATLDWVASPRGGEKARAVPEQVLKKVDDTWADGPCRRCRCEAGAGGAAGAAVSCSSEECAVAGASELVVVEARPVPYACCPALVPVACRHGDRVYKVGENWTSPTDPCESYVCTQMDDGELEKVTTKKTCDDTCQPGWKYVPANATSGECCGECEPVACVVEGRERAVGDAWTSPDFCTDYECVLDSGALQVQSSNKSCPVVSLAMEKQFVMSEETIPGQCCKKREPLACRVGKLIYQEGQTWPTSDPCKNMTCSRDESGRLTHSASVTTCPKDCKLGWKYEEPKPGVCCGQCVQDKCVVDGELKEPDSVWSSADNCTEYSCERVARALQVTGARTVCPDVSACAPADLVNDTCCMLCKEKPMSLSKCAPVALTGAASVGAVRATLRPHGACANDRPLVGFYECRGACDSGTLYNNATGIHDSKCECCTAMKYGSADVWLLCEDGSRHLHRVASPARCACAACGSAPGRVAPRPTKGGIKTGGGPKQMDYPDTYDIPEIYQRMRSDEDRPQ